jgi:hypothetical protein
VHEDLGSIRADRYLIAEAALQMHDKRLPEGMQAARQVTARNADAPVAARDGRCGHTSVA